MHTSIAAVKNIFSGSQSEACQQSLSSLMQSSYECFQDEFQLELSVETNLDGYVVDIKIDD
jgi:hypothetical protein